MDGPDHGGNPAPADALGQPEGGSIPPGSITKVRGISFTALCRMERDRADDALAKQAKETRKRNRARNEAATERAVRKLLGDQVDEIGGFRIEWDDRHFPGSEWPTMVVVGDNDPIRFRPEKGNYHDVALLRQLAECECGSRELVALVSYIGTLADVGRNLGKKGPLCSKCRAAKAREQVTQQIAEEPLSIERELVDVLGRFVAEYGGQVVWEP